MGLSTYCDHFTSASSVNDLLSSNISILVGPMQTSAVLATHPLCLRARVPQIAPLTSLRLVPMKTEGVNFLVRMSPTEALKAEVLKEIVKSFGWKTMAVYGYKDKEGLLKVFKRKLTWDFWEMWLLSLGST